MNVYRTITWSILWVTLLLSGSAIAEEKETPSGTVVIDETQVMFIVGGSSGGGTLLFGDESYSFTVGGMKLGGIGAHKIHLVGNVYDLKDVADFPGDYVSWQAGLTAGVGKSGMWMKNSKDVRLHLKSSKDVGLALSIGVEGFTIKMK